MKFTVNLDFRKFKAGDIYDFSEIEKLKTICIVGDNGCGKSSLFHALRGMKNDMETSSTYNHNCKLLAVNVDISHGYDKIFYLDSVLDDGRNFNNAYDATGLIESGGYNAGFLSHGESSLMYISRFLTKFSENIKDEEKTLLVFDEIDKGFSLSNQSKYINIIANLSYKYKNLHIIYITHNVITIKQSLLVYDFENKKIMPSTKYLAEKIGFKIEKAND